MKLHYITARKKNFKSDDLSRYLLIKFIKTFKPNVYIWFGLGVNLDH